MSLSIFDPDFSDDDRETIAERDVERCTDCGELFDKAEMRLGFCLPCSKKEECPRCGEIEALEDGICDRCWRKEAAGQALFDALNGH